MIAFVLLRVFLILLLVAANAFFAAAEFALVSVRDTRIQQLIEAGRIGARIVQRLHPHLDEVVNGVQLGITMVSLTLGWIGEPMVAGLVGSLRFVQRLPHRRRLRPRHRHRDCLQPDHLHARDPGRTGAQDAGPAARRADRPRGRRAHGGLPHHHSPPPVLHAASGGLVLRLFGAQPTRRGGAVHSPDELKLIVTASRQFGQIPEFQEEMIHSAIELDSITVREVMVARPDIFSLPSDLHAR